MALSDPVLTLIRKWRDDPNAAPPLDGEAQAAWEEDLVRVRSESAQLAKALAAGREGDETHTEVRGWLRDLGTALGFATWVAANDRNRSFGQGKLGDGRLGALPAATADAPGAEAVSLIETHRESIARFGSGMKAIQAISHELL